LVTAVERFRKFLFGRHFILQTDHRPLLALFRTSNTKGLDTRTANRLKRWALRLIGYDFDIEYVRTDHFGYADALSRLIHETRQATDPEMEEVVASLSEIDSELQQLVVDSTNVVSPDVRRMLQEETFTDSILAEVADRLLTGWLSSDAKDADLAPFDLRRDALALVDRTIICDEKVVIPHKQRSLVLQKLHIAHPFVA